MLTFIAVAVTSTIAAPSGGPPPPGHPGPPPPPFPPLPAPPVINYQVVCLSHPLYTCLFTSLTAIELLLIRFPVLLLPFYQQ
jgi:hypothetical protein